GPNQEFAVSAALSIENIEDVVIVGLDTDGTDGPTDYAGAISDKSTVLRARELCIDLFDSLKRHAVTPALCKLGDAIHTGATGTNVNDLKFMIVSQQD
ncbi:MAG: MOFRL family protein, partial [Desulfobacterales bacterium]